MRKTNILIYCMVTCVFFMAVSNVFATAGSNIIYKETDMGGGTWQYDYTFYNTSTSESLYSVYLYFAQETSFTGTSLPMGWDGIVWNGSTWTATFADTYSTGEPFDIASGNSLGGFIFTVDYRAGNISYDAYFSGDDVVSGNTAPVVPEPVSSILFATGGVTLLLRSFINKRQTGIRKDILLT